MQHGGEDPAHQIEHDEAEMAHGVLDIVAEHPQEQHVAEEVDPAPVQEHVGDEGEALRHGNATGGEHRHRVGAAAISSAGMTAKAAVFSSSSGMTQPVSKIR